MKIYKITSVAALMLLFFACNTEHANKNIEKSIESELEEFAAVSLDSIVETSSSDVVFYNMFSPVDLNTVIDKKSSYYNSAYINPLSNITKYTLSNKIALNTGIYGADLSYLWMFEQTQQALSYLSAVQHLTAKLGIPDSFVKSTFLLAESQADQMDSLIIIVKTAFNDTDKYLKNTERENSASLILLGGWIETLHIALNMYTEADSKLAAKIITQKYSLGSLITMMQNHQEDITMSEYLLLLKKLQTAYNNINLTLQKNDINIDTINKRISITNTSNIHLQPKDFDEIKSITSKIRDHIIR